MNFQGDAANELSDEAYDDGVIIEAAYGANGTVSSLHFFVFSLRSC